MPALRGGPGQLVELAVIIRREHRDHRHHDRRKVGRRPPVHVPQVGPQIVPAGLHAQVAKLADRRAGLSVCSAIRSTTGEFSSTGKRLDGRAAMAKIIDPLHADRRFENAQFPTRSRPGRRRCATRQDACQHEEPGDRHPMFHLEFRNRGNNSAECSQPLEFRHSQRGEKSGLNCDGGKILRWLRMTVFRLLQTLKFHEL